MSKKVLAAFAPTPACTVTVAGEMGYVTPPTVKVTAEPTCASVVPETIRSWLLSTALM